MPSSRALAGVWTPEGGAERWSTPAGVAAPEGGAERCSFISLSLLSSAGFIPAETGLVVPDGIAEAGAERWSPRSPVSVAAKVMLVSFSFGADVMVSTAGGSRVEGCCLFRARDAISVAPGRGRGWFSSEVELGLEMADVSWVAVVRTGRGMAAEVG